MVTNYGYKIPVLKVVGLNPTGVTCLYICDKQFQHYSPIADIWKEKVLKVVGLNPTAIYSKTCTSPWPLLLCPAKEVRNNGS